MRFGIPMDIVPEAAFLPNNLVGILTLLTSISHFTQGPVTAGQGSRCNRATVRLARKARRPTDLSAFRWGRASLHTQPCV